MTGTGWNCPFLKSRILVFLALAAIILGAVLLTVTSPGSARAAAPSEELPEGTMECLECHEDEDMEKDLVSGEKLSLHIDANGVRRSVHVDEGCEACHGDISLDSHPEEREIASRREYRARISQACGECHEDDRDTEKPHHRKLVSRKGAPACAECHQVHSIEPADKWKASLDEAAYCIVCHSTDISLTLGDGEKKSLVMDENTLKTSVHLDHDCTECHADFGKESHAIRYFESRRDHSIVLSALCRDCHEEMYDQLEGSIHSSIMESGNNSAPICTDCHGFHSVGPAEALKTIAGVPCRQCHQEVFSAYRESMHGKAWEGEGHLEAPICADCHRSHGVSPISWVERLKEACISCHENVDRAHDAWLPNAAIHLEAVSCPSCHSPRAERRIDLVLSDINSSRPISEKALRGMLENGDLALRDFSMGELSGVDLWKMLRAANREGNGAPVEFVGRIEVKTGPDAHRLASKNEALRDCDVCHRKDSETFAQVAISLTGSDGRSLHYPADRDVLTSAASMGSVRGFYTLGSTRIMLLDFLLIAAVLGGMSVPALHMSARLLTRKQ